MRNLFAISDDLAEQIRPKTGLIHVVDDDTGVRRSLARILQSVGHSVAEHDSVADFFHTFYPSSPAVVLVDMRMPVASGLNLLRRARQLGIETPLVFISGESSTPEAVAAMKDGAFDFLFKPVAFDELIRVVEAALCWDAEQFQVAARRRAFIARLETLTPREAELCASIARDDKIKEIASQFHISEATVKIHKARILTKLEIRSVSDLALNLARFAPKRAASAAGSDSLAAPDVEA